MKKHFNQVAFIFTLSFVSSFTAGAAPHSVIITPTQSESFGALNFVDDLDFDGIDIAIQRQINARVAPEQTAEQIQLGKDRYPIKAINESLKHFQTLVKDFKTCTRVTWLRPICRMKFNLQLKKDFNLYRPSRNTSHFTAYYSPDFQASFSQSDLFNLPIYSKPEDTALGQLSRSQILFDHAYEGKVAPIAFLHADPFELYSLQIEGGGRIRIKDKNEKGEEKIKFLNFNGSNEKKLNFISSILLKRGYLTADHLSIDEQHAFLLSHLDLVRSIFDESPNYVFFKLSDQEPTGIQEIPLTENRSLALDKQHYPIPGLLNFVQTKKTVDSSKKVTQIPFSRFFIHQDTGSAIVGEARADLYFGYGRNGYLNASRLNDEGKQYFLMKKSLVAASTASANL